MNIWLAAGVRHPRGEDICMAECDFLMTCRFFNESMDDKAAVGEILKQRFCMGDNGQCARLAVRDKLGPAAVPPAMWPNDVATAQKLIEGL